MKVPVNPFILFQDGQLDGLASAIHLCFDEGVGGPDDITIDLLIEELHRRDLDDYNLPACLAKDF